MVTPVNLTEDDVLPQNNLLDVFIDVSTLYNLFNNAVDVLPQSTFLDVVSDV